MVITGSGGNSGPDSGRVPAEDPIDSRTGSGGLPVDDTAPGAVECP